jgi:FkbM family methyltransferase
MFYIFSRKLFKFSRAIHKWILNDENSDLNTNGEGNFVRYFCSTNLNSSKAVYIDVGANKGEYSILLRKHGFIGNVILIEPILKNLSLAKKNLLLISKFPTVFINGAISGKSQKHIQFFTSTDKYNEKSSLRNDLYSNKMSFKSMQVKNITNQEFTKIIQEIDGHYFIKIDTEGAENIIIKQLLNQKRLPVHIQFEFSIAARNFDYCALDLWQNLTSNGYSLFLIHRNSLIPIPYHPYIDNFFACTNFVAISQKYLDLYCKYINKNVLFVF